MLDETRTERCLSYAAVQFTFLETLSSMSHYVDEGRERSIHADQLDDLLALSNMVHLEQPLFLLGHGVENPVNSFHGDEEYLYIVGLLTQHPSDAPAEWTVKVSNHAGFPQWNRPTDETFERASWQLHESLEAGLKALSHVRVTTLESDPVTNSERFNNGEITSISVPVI